MLLIMRVDYRVWARFAKVLLAIGFLGLAVVLVFKIAGFGKVRGAYRWIPLPGGAFQPADLMRLALRGLSGGILEPAPGIGKGPGSGLPPPYCHNRPGDGLW